ncbi:MAG: hypothetical protein WCZ89_07450, partial [Phycisphaerae bacterium]
MVIIIILAYGEMMSSYLTQINAINAKSQTASLLAAEAGYEKALYWMSEQPDILGSLKAGEGSGVIDFGTSNCEYKVSFHSFMGARPLFRIRSIGTSGRPVFSRVIDVAVVQEVTGWAMDLCQIPTGTNATANVYFGNNEIVEMPIHINNRNDIPDNIDINILGSPLFKRKVYMGESRTTPGGADKYASVMPLFQDGILFDQPYVRITDSAAVNSKLNRFRDSTKPAYRFTPDPPNTSVPSPRDSAVQLEFYVQGGTGRVRITNNCTVKLISSGFGSVDYMMTPAASP